MQLNFWTLLAALLWSILLHVMTTTIKTTSIMITITIIVTMAANFKVRLLHTGVVLGTLYMLFSFNHHENPVEQIIFSPRYR